MAHPDLNALKDALLPLAKRMLATYGEFFPYGAFMRPNGEIVDCGVQDRDEHPPSEKLLHVLTREFRRRAVNKEIRAAGICCDVKVSRPGSDVKTDAIQFRLEHVNGEAVDVFIPYKLVSVGKIEFEEMFATARDREVFI